MMTAIMQPEKKVLALVCLQAQHVAGLPAAAEGRQIVLRLLHCQQQQQETAARCRAGVAAFHDQVLLLHCAPVHGITSVDVTVSFPDDLPDDQVDCYTTAIDLAAQLHRPSPSVLSFVLGGGAVLSLTLHHRLVHRRRSACQPLPTIPDLLLNCCLRTPADPVVTGKDDDQQSSSSGFITIEKGTISRRRPPSDNLLTTDDDEGDGGKPTSCWTSYPPVETLAEELEIEKEFLDNLELADDHRRTWDLDALIKDANY